MVHIYTTNLGSTCNNAFSNTSWGNLFRSWCTIVRNSLPVVIISIFVDGISNIMCSFLYTFVFEVNAYLFSYSYCQDQRNVPPLFSNIPWMPPVNNQIRKVPISLAWILKVYFQILKKFNYVNFMSNSSSQMCIAANVYFKELYAAVQRTSLTHFHCVFFMK